MEISEVAGRTGGMGLDGIGEFGDRLVGCLGQDLHEGLKTRVGARDRLKASRLVLKRKGGLYSNMHIFY